MIKDNKKLPKGLVQKQELQRQETVNKVLRACADIKKEGGKVTIATMVEYTGLSRSTFSKPHIRNLLVKYRSILGGDTVVQSERKKVKQAEAIAARDRQISEVKAKNVELEKECSLLRGKLFVILQNQIKWL